MTAATAGRVWGGTFHAMANRLLRIYGRPLGLNENFTVADRSDAEDLLNEVRGDIGLECAGNNACSQDRWRYCGRMHHNHQAIGGNARLCTDDCASF